MKSDRAGDVWRALANPHRRRLLDALRAGPRTTGDLAGELPELSRYAVMQHLGVLTDAGLVLVRRDGRVRTNFLNAVPIQEAYDRWVGGLAATAANNATALRRHVEAISHPPPERNPAMPDTDKPVRAVRIENEIPIAAPREKVFTALTQEQHSWYPYNYGGERVKTISLEPRVGGQCIEEWGDGAGVLYSLVWHYDPPAALCLRGYLRDAVNLEQWFTFVDDGSGGTILRQSLTACGPLSDDDAAGIRTHGDLSLHADALRSYLGLEVPA